MSPWISVVVPSFNQARFLEQTLWSLFEQNIERLEIIVVDGGSTDGSVDIIHRYADRLGWWVSEPDQGQSHALNKGFAKARGEWLGWLNSDDLLLPGALQTLSRYIDAKPDCEWWIGGGFFINEAGKRIRKYGPPYALKCVLDLSDWRNCWFAQPSTFFKRRLFDSVGGHVREDLCFAMDLNLWLRFLQVTVPSIMEEEVSCYRLHSCSKTSVLTAEGEVEINKVLMQELGFDAVLDRIRCIAADRETFEHKLLRLEKALAPLLDLYKLTQRLFYRSY